MDTETFWEKVKKELKTLTGEQIVYFAWICGIRALPFLGSNGNFNFWKKENKQKHLYAIFYALDFCAANAANAAAFRDVTIEGDAFDTSAFAAFDDAARAAVFDAISAAFAVDAFDASAAAARAAARAAAATRAIARTNDFDEAIDAAFDAFAAFDAAAAKHEEFESIILHDIEALRMGGAGSIKISNYGRVWDNFLKALNAEGSDYWGKLYKNIFRNGFELAKRGAEERVKVPREIREQGVTAVGNYLEQFEQGSEKLNEARIIILGEKGAGKTCLARRLINPNAPMTTEYDSTAGVDKTLWELEENINVHIWDFAGHTVTHAVHQFFLSERCLYIIVYDGRTEERNRLEYWLDHMKNYGGNSKAIILVNKRDLHSVEVPINRLKERYSIVDYYTFSIQDDKNKLEKFREVVSNFIRNNPSWDKQLIPFNYYKVKKELEKRFKKGDRKRCEEHITKEEFCRIANRNGVDNSDVLLTHLNALGISLWYSKMEEFNTLVLNPEWISHGVYKIVNWVNEEKKHSLTIEEFENVFKGDETRYPVDKYEFFFKLMEHYELAYKTDRGKCLIIPHLLKEDRPESLLNFPVGESLMLRYKADQPLPPNTISRFIVRHNHEIKKDFVWRYGVVLEDGKGSVALVREEDRTISVSVKGDFKTKFISTLRETLNDIFNSYKSSKPELQYRIERFGQIPDEIERKNPLWLTDTKILNHLRNNVPYYEDISGQNIDLHYTVNNYNISAQTLISVQGNVFTNKSIHNTFNFHDCNINLQGSLSELARIVEKKGNKEGAEELKDIAETLEQAEKCKTPEEVKKKGLVNGLKRIVQDLGDEDSKLHKTISGVKQGVSIAQDIAKGYNDIAQWLGLPQVPKPFLKKEDKN